MNKQVLPTLYSQVREEKILSKHALLPRSWTAPTSWELGRGLGTSPGNSNRDSGLFYRTTLGKKPRSHLVSSGNELYHLKPLWVKGAGEELFEFALVFFSLCLAGRGEKKCKGELRFWTCQSNETSVDPLEPGNKFWPFWDWTNLLFPLSFALWESLEYLPESVI